MFVCWNCNHSITNMDDVKTSVVQHLLCKKCTNIVEDKMLEMYSHLVHIHANLLLLQKTYKCEILGKKVLLVKQIIDEFCIKHDFEKNGICKRCRFKIPLDC